MTFPIHFSNLLPPSVFFYMQDDLKEWEFNNSSKQEDSKAKTFFGKRDTSDVPNFYKVSTFITLHIKKRLRENLKLVRIHCNGKVYGTNPSFHIDYDRVDQCYTFIFFTKPTWNTDYGGEFVCQDPLTNEYKYTPYIPNNGVLIPSYWQHKGTSPLTPDAGVRTSLAFMYTKEENYKKLLSKYQESYFFS